MLWWMQARCPIYLVNVSSMSAGDMIAAAKMQGEKLKNNTSMKILTVVMT